MSKTRLLSVLSLLAATAAGTVNAAAADRPDVGQGAPLPRVLLIGDSICGGYHKEVKKRLAGQADVVGPVANAEYTGTGLNQLEMWQADTFDPATIDRELGWTAAIGMNSVRVYLHDLLWQQDREGFLQRIDRFLDIADKHHIMTLFVMCDAVWNPHPKPGKQPAPRPHVHNSGWVQSPDIEILRDEQRHDSLAPYFKGVIGRFKDDRRVLGWDLYNEPGNDGEEDRMTTLEKEGKCLLLLTRMFAWARQVNPSQPLTTGLWSKEWVGPDATPLNRFIVANSDVISFHIYDRIDKTRARVDSLTPLGRPLLCTEYLARGAGSHFEDHLPYFKQHKIGAYNWGFVAGKIQTQYPWSSWRKKFTAEPELWHHDASGGTEPPSGTRKWT